jgi:hypothetical protein
MSTNALKRTVFALQKTLSILPVVTSETFGKWTFSPPSGPLPSLLCHVTMMKIDCSKKCLTEKLED